MLSMILLLAFSPAILLHPNNTPASVDKDVDCIAPPAMQHAGRATPAKPTPLGELPPGITFHTVQRNVGNCIIPAVIAPPRGTPNPVLPRKQTPRN